MERKEFVLCRLCAQNFQLTIPSQYPVITASESAFARHVSPHPSLYQNTPTGSFYNRSSSSSALSLDPDAPLERRKKEAPEGPQAGVGDKKGKKKALADAQSPSSTHETGMDPLEIAYGPTIGTHTEITTDDFKVDTDGQHKPHQEAARPSRQSASEAADRSTAEDSHNRSDVGENDESSRNTSPAYGVEGEDEFRNVWGR